MVVTPFRPVARQQTAVHVVQTEIGHFGERGDERSNFLARDETRYRRHSPEMFVKKTILITHV